MALWKPKSEIPGFLYQKSSEIDSFRHISPYFANDVHNFTILEIQNPGKISSSRCFPALKTMDFDANT